MGTENGKLGYPVSKEICGLRNGGCYQAFQGGTIHYVPGIGAFATWGGIRTAWGAVGYDTANSGTRSARKNAGCATAAAIKDSRAALSTTPRA